MKTCKKCGTMFAAKRSDAVFCSPNCRKLHSKHTKRDRQKEALNKLGFDSIGDLVEWVEASDLNHVFAMRRMIDKSTSRFVYVPVEGVEEVEENVFKIELYEYW